MWYSADFLSGCWCFSSFPWPVCHLLASFVSLWTLLRIRGFCVFDFGNSAQHQPVCYLMSFFLGILSSSQDMVHCQLSSTVCTCTTCQRASFNSTTDSFSWGQDPYTLACKARPSFDRCGTSLSVIVIVIVLRVERSTCLQQCRFLHFKPGEAVDGDSKKVPNTAPAEHKNPSRRKGF